MYIGVKSVNPLENFTLLLTFDNNEKKVFDMKPYLNVGIFKDLQEISLFNSVHTSYDTIEWNNGADLCPETLYNEGVTVS